MKDEIKEIKVNKANKSITFINNGIAFSQFGVADEILDLITNLQEKYDIAQKDIEVLKNNYNDLVKMSENKINILQEENERIKTIWKDTNVVIRNDKTIVLNQNAFDYLISIEQENDMFKVRCDYLQRSCERKEKQMLDYRMEYMEQEDYKSKCEKALDKLYCYGEIFDSKILQQFQKEMENILQGEDDK